MDAWAPIVVPAMIAIGGGFAWLIREIVKSSKDAVAGAKSNFLRAARASGAPRRRSMPASSHSTEMGPS